MPTAREAAYALTQINAGIVSRDKARALISYRDRDTNMGKFQRIVVEGKIKRIQHFRYGRKLPLVSDPDPSQWPEGIPADHPVID